MDVPENLKKTEDHAAVMDKETITLEKIRNRKSLKDFWSKFKDGIIDLFKEEEDQHL